MDGPDYFEEWYEEGQAICFKNGSEGEIQTWCGAKDKCHKGLLLPLFLEVTWPKEARAVLYFIGLCFSFLGVSIVADVFMCAIEKITSKTKQIHVAGQDGDKDEGPEVIEVPVWNGTVANLTLMALGSSAPEILLSVIEIVGNNFTAGELGPGTIVGSAAFNLLCISIIPSSLWLSSLVLITWPLSCQLILSSLIVSLWTLRCLCRIVVLCY